MGNVIIGTNQFPNPFIKDGITMKNLGDEKYKLLESIIVRSFMSPRTGVAKKNARLGHLLEEPLGINLLKDSDANVTPVKITALYKA
ncbi:MAG: hypothetical protein ACREBR_04260, partial [bacterium]